MEILGVYKDCIKKRLRFWMTRRKEYRENRAFARLTLNRDFAIVDLNDVFDDGEA